MWPLLGSGKAKAFPWIWTINKRLHGNTLIGHLMETVIKLTIFFL
jgi:hypothetical protein